MTLDEQRHYAYVALLARPAPAGRSMPPAAVPCEPYALTAGAGRTHAAWLEQLAYAAMLDAPTRIGRYGNLFDSPPAAPEGPFSLID